VRDDAQRDAEYTRGLGEELARSYRRLTVLMPTHLVARSIFDRAGEAFHTRDVYKLIRFQDGIEVPVETVRRDVGRWLDGLLTRPEWGSVSDRLHGREPAGIVDDAMRMFASYHTVPAAERTGDKIVVRDMRLVFYYQNRTAHVPAGAIP
jgi:glycerol-3-phosphate O-acyltransferase